MLSALAPSEFAVPRLSKYGLHMQAIALCGLVQERAVSLQSYDINAQEAPEDLQVAVNAGAYFSALSNAAASNVDLTSSFSTFANQVLAPGQDNLTDGLASILIPPSDPEQVTIIIMDTPGMPQRAHTWHALCSTRRTSSDTHALCRSVQPMM